MKKSLSLLLLVLCAAGAAAQQLDADFFAANPDCAGGIYYTYHFDPGRTTPVPKGFKPVYISHFGRHGSRWHAKQQVYATPQEVLNKAAGAGALTEYGEWLRAKVDDIASRAWGREGELTPQGVAEHKGIAERMYRSYPSLFKGKGVHIEAYSSYVPRCILSMSAFVERLKELNPNIDAVRICNDKCQTFTRPIRGAKHIGRPVREATTDGLLAAAAKPVERLTAKIFRSDAAAFVEANRQQIADLVHYLYFISITMQDSEGDDRLDELFTPQERFEIWEKINIQRYGYYGASVRWGDAILADAINLMQNIVDDADQVLAAQREGKYLRSALLRFGHDITVIATVSAMAVEGRSVRTDDFGTLKDVWADFRISPMAANIQFIFYRNKAGQVLVKMLHNEQECRLPIAGGQAPYYRWEDLRGYMTSLVEKYSHLPIIDSLPKGRFPFIGDKRN